MTFVVWEQPTFKAFERDPCEDKAQNTQSQRVLGITEVFLSVWPEDLLHWGLCILQPVRRHVLRIQESLWIARERGMWRFGSLPWRLTWVIGQVLSLVSSRVIRWRHSLLSSILASLTRRTVVTTTGTALPNPRLHQASGSIPYPPYLLVCLREVIACLPHAFYFTVWRLVTVWLHTVFHSDPFYLAAVSLRAFTILLAWLLLV